MALSVRELIEKLNNYGGDVSVKIVNISEHGEEHQSNFQCDSWRGAYAYPGAILENYGEGYTIDDIVSNLEDVEGMEVTGHKGGDFVLDENDTVFLVTSRTYAGTCTAPTKVYQEAGSDIVVIEVQNNQF